MEATTLAAGRDIKAFGAPGILSNKRVRTAGAFLTVDAVAIWCWGWLDEELEMSDVASRYCVINGLGLVPVRNAVIECQKKR